MAPEAASRTIDEALLRAGLEALRSAGAWPEGLVSSLEAFVRHADDVDLYRVDPISWADGHSVSSSVAVDLFLHAARASLFDLSWEMVCQGCGWVLKRLEHLKDVREHLFCHTCQNNRDMSLDEFIVVSFTVSPRLAGIEHHHPERLPFERRLFDCLITRFIVLQEGRRLVDHFRQAAQVVTTVEPGERKAFSVVVSPGLVYGGPGFLASVDGGPGERVLDLVVSSGRLQPSRARLSSGALEISITNTDDEPADVCLFGAPEPPIFRRPLGGLSAKRLIHSTTWRRLFGDDLPLSDSALTVRDVAILFTDLKGSTALYQRVGDLAAWSLVFRHFHCVQRVVEECGGVWVKSIGDAVMASFMAPEDAVKAARAMLRAVSALDANGDLSLKIGVHAGPAIVVAMNGALDYFGHTVNLAARVQGLAQAGEVCVSDSVYQIPAVSQLLAGAHAERMDAELRGIAATETVWRIIG